MRLLLSILALVLLATFAPPRLFKEPPVPKQTRVWFEPVPLDVDNPGRRRVGPLTYLGGWSIRSNDPRYGGISAIHVEGGELLALSDAGYLMHHQLPGAGRQGLPVRLIFLREGPGPMRSKKGRDSEAMSVDRRHIRLSYERSNSVWRYRRDDLRAEAHAEPPPMQGWGSNSGGEAMAALSGGRYLIVPEGRRRAEHSEAVLFSGDPAAPGARPQRLSVRRPAYYRVTDAAPLPDGRLLLLQRRISLLHGMSAKLTIVPERALKPGATIEPREIAHFEPPLTVDNMEGLSVTREGGRTILWMASDNNFNGLQRTLLLKFAFSG